MKPVVERISERRAKIKPRASTDAILSICIFLYNASKPVYYTSAKNRYPIKWRIVLKIMPALENPGNVSDNGF